MIIRKIIQEEIRKVFEIELTEEYPLSFNMEEFKKLTSFAQRINYCEQHLQRISSGSSRIVYKIDDIKVLKLAKNKKGLAQNEVEIQYSSDNYISDITAIVFEHHPENLWVEMELAKKLTTGEFKKITGFDWNDYCNVLWNYDIDANNAKLYRKDVSPEISEAMWEDEFIYSILSFIGNYSIPSGDLIKLNSYGIVNRDGENTIVMIDYGFNNNVYQSYYS